MQSGLLYFPAASLLTSGMFSLVFPAGFVFVGCFVCHFLIIYVFFVTQCPASSLYDTCQFSFLVPLVRSMLNYSLKLEISHITFTSWNCRGMGKALKRGKVFSHLKSMLSEIVFLQETQAF